MDDLGYERVFVGVGRRLSFKSWTFSVLIYIPPFCFYAYDDHMLSVIRIYIRNSRHPERTIY